MIKKKKNKNRIILCLCSIFLLVASIFSFIPLTKQTNQVYADTIVGDFVFEGSQLFIPTARFTYKYVNNVRSVVQPFNYRGYTSTTNFEYLTTLFSVDFRYNQNTGLLQFRPKFWSMQLHDGNYVDNEGITGFNEYIRLNYVARDYSSYFYGFNNTYLNLIDYATNVDILVANDSGPNYFPNGTNSEVTGIIFELTKSVIDIDISKITHMSIVLNPSLNDRSRYVVTYYDVNLNYVEFKFGCGFFDTGLPSRTYYFNNENMSDNEYYSQGYTAGESKGYNNGYTTGKTDGYSQGYSAGQTFGYNSGFAAGQENTNQYTFLNLVSSVIDAPMTYFQSLFNFELLGVNLQGFLMALFTLCVVVTIVRLCLGK